MVYSPVLVVSPLQQRGQLEAEVSLGLLQGVKQQRHRVVRPPLQPLAITQYSAVQYSTVQYREFFEL